MKSPGVDRIQALLAAGRKDEAIALMLPVIAAADAREKHCRDLRRVTQEDRDADKKLVRRYWDRFVKLHPGERVVIGEVVGLMERQGAIKAHGRDDRPSTIYRTRAEACVSALAREHRKRDQRKR